MSQLHKIPTGRHNMTPKAWLADAATDRDRCLQLPLLRCFTDQHAGSTRDGVALTRG